MNNSSKSHQQVGISIDGKFIHSLLPVGKDILRWAGPGEPRIGKAHALGEFCKRHNHGLTAGEPVGSHQLA